MRIQHNIMAMNSYRNYTSNTSALSKNLEKLSSGYKINRAGDDAAGLAISEKMRAQITGLSQAQANAKSGINLVQTAEGALTEVHDMLNRMVKLADQSANGTYDNDVDRKNLQKEITQLKSEIDRIADASNFNGIKLLDGTLGSTGASGVAVDVKYANLNNNAGVLTLKSATPAKALITAGGSSALSNGAKYTLELTFADADGNLQKKSVEFTSAGARADGSNSAFLAAVQKAVGDGYTAANSSGKINITSNNAGAADKLEVYNISLKNAAGAAVSSAPAVGTGAAGEDAYYELDATKLSVFDGNGEPDIFEINGQKFAFANAANVKDIDPDVHVVTTSNNPPQSADADNMVTVINDKTGISATNSAGKISLKAGTKAGTTGKGLTLQIGDTSEKFNKLTVSVQDMHTSALGIGGIDISTQDGAAAAVEKIKNAINTVSSVRGDLGATQNRLEHTMNNLSVMQENIQDAEATIRDVDVADEMMAYTKNNILVQSAQAMLAQANQVPQGVLQLLR